MRVLRAGPMTFGVTAEVEACWADLEARSRAFAEDRGDDAPFVRFRTDTGAGGSIPLVAEAPVTFRDVDEPDPDHHGTIVSVLPGDPTTIGDDLTERTSPSADPDIEGMPEDERLRILADLHELSPHVDHARLAAGTLAGRATADRPDVPPWEYQRHVDEHPGSSLEELLRVRFPEVFADRRGSTVHSIADDVDDHGRPEGALFTVAEALDRWRFLFDAGVVRWNGATRAVEHVVDFGEWFAAEREWATHLRQRRADDG